MDITILWSSDEDGDKSFFGVFSDYKKAKAFEDYLSNNDKYNWYAEEGSTNFLSLQDCVDYYRRFESGVFLKPSTSKKHDVILHTYLHKYNKFFMEYNDE